jgi:putative endonuclease
MATRMNRRSVGRYGEQVAAAYLRQHGYEIIVENWRCPRGEIDLVACENTTLVFVEVRTKTTSRFGTPEESLDRRKIQRLHRLVQAFLTSPVRRKMLTHDYRIDVVCIDLDYDKETVLRIRHIKHAV